VVHIPHVWHIFSTHALVFLKVHGQVKVSYFTSNRNGIFTIWLHFISLETNKQRTKCHSIQKTAKLYSLTRSTSNIFSNTNL